MITDGRKLILVQLVLLVCAASSVVASPSMVLDGSVAVAFVEPTVLAVSATDSLDLDLADIGREMFGSTASTVASDSSYGGSASLPAVPTAAAMLVMGFLCVTLVKDRKHWAVVLTATLSLGHIGLQSLPRLATGLCQGIKSGGDQMTDLGRIHLFKNADRARCDIEGSSYIALLRHLSGIPLLSGFSEMRRSVSLSQVSDKYERENDRLQLAADLSSRLMYAYRCVTVSVRQYVCFTPAFIFNNLSRGPPA